jgi:hypothetical protein
MRIGKRACRARRASRSPGGWSLSGKIDFLNIIRGHIDSDAALNNVIPIQGMASAPHLDFAGEIRAATKFPVFHAARIADVATARHAIAEGKLDMVGMTRPHIADPHIVRKIEAGEEAASAPASAQPTVSIASTRAARRSVSTMRRPAAKASCRTCRSRAGPRRAVVVGAGPAGLEAARVLAERGHKVDLLEASAKAGGQINLLVRNPRRREMIGIVDWRLANSNASASTIHYNVFAGQTTFWRSIPIWSSLRQAASPNLRCSMPATILSPPWDIIAGATSRSETCCSSTTMAPSGHVGSRSDRQ